VRVEARNEYGWSQPSEPLVFRTRPEYKGISTGYVVFKKQYH
jgi:hypothetical protein